MFDGFLIKYVSSRDFCNFKGSVKNKQTYRLFTEDSFISQCFPKNFIDIYLLLYYTYLYIYSSRVIGYWLIIYPTSKRVVGYVVKS